MARYEHGMSIYSSKVLKDTARWALSHFTCPVDAKRLTMQDYELQIPRDTSPRLHIIGQCKQHQYIVDTYCTI